MDLRRLLLATVLSLAFTGLWFTFVVPRIAPRRPVTPARPGAASTDPGPPVGATSDGPATAVGPQRPGAEQAPEAGEPAEGDPNSEPGGGEPNRSTPGSTLPNHPARVLQLGSLDPATGFRQYVTLDSRGAAIKSIELSDPHYQTLTKPRVPLTVVGDGGVQPRSLELDIPEAGRQWRRLNWQVVELTPEQAPHSRAVFELEQAGLRVRKTYELRPVETSGDRPEAIAYALRFAIEVKNLRSDDQSVRYVLQGPTGLPLENIDNTTKYRDVVAGFLTSPTAVNHQLMTGANIADGKTEEWQRPVQYVGLDAQYFAALLCPQGDAFGKPPFDSIKQVLLERDRQVAVASQVGIELTSIPVTLAPAGAGDGTDSLQHEFTLFAGPKSDDVLPPLADQMIDFGSFFGLGRRLISFTGRRLMKLLVLLQGLTGSWGLAIIGLVLLVRAAMLPISIQQARNAARMQELAPKMAAIKEKYKDDPTQQMRETHQLYRQNNVKPFQLGCLPALLQMPIFIGLYGCLNHAVALRLEPFLYFDNLAAPDHLTALPFTVPFLGWKQLNLLPVIVYGLFMLQNKLFAPPPMNEEQEVQMKTMNFMMIFMLVMFYKVPSGLCLYFIVSSLWGITEKLLLPKKKPVALAGDAAGELVSEPSVVKPRREIETPAPEKKTPGFWDLLVKAAEKPNPVERKPGSNDRKSRPRRDR